MFLVRRTENNMSSADNSIAVQRLKLVFLIALSRIGRDDLMNAVDGMKISDLDLSVDAISTLANHIATNLSLTAEIRDRLKNEVSVYLLKARENDILRDLTYTGYMSNILGKELSRSDVGRECGTFLDVDKIIHHFAEIVFDRCTTAYPIESSGAIGWIRDYFAKKYIPEYKADLMREFSKRGYSVESDDGDLSLADLQTIDVERKIDFDFKRCVSRIYEASKVIYRNTRRKEGESLYYDLVSKYKYGLLLKYKKTIDKRMRSIFLESNRPRINIADVNLDSGLGDYSKDSKAVRDKILVDFDILITGGISPVELLDLLKSSIRYDFVYKEPDGKHRSTLYKQVANLENSNASILQCMNSTAVQDVFYTIVAGYSSLSDLLSFLDKRGLTIFDVPSDIFRNPQMMARFDDFDDYILSYEDTKELMNNAKGSGEFSSNDALYENLLSFVKAGDFRFSTIKDIIDHTEKKNLISGVNINTSRFVKPFNNVTHMLERLHKLRSTVVSVINKLNDMGWNVIQLGKDQYDRYDIISVDTDRLNEVFKIKLFDQLFNSFTEDERVLFFREGHQQYAVLYMMSYLNFSISALCIIKIMLLFLIGKCNTKINLIRVRELSNLLDLPLTITSIEDIGRYTKDDWTSNFLQLFGLTKNVFDEIQKDPSLIKRSKVHLYAYNYWVTLNIFKDSRFRIYEELEYSDNYQEDSISIMCWLFLNHIMTNRDLYNNISKQEYEKLSPNDIDKLPCLKQVFVDINDLKESIYDELQENSISEANSKSIRSEHLKRTGITLLKRASILSPNLKKFLARPDVVVDEENYGYVFKNGRPYVKIEESHVLYLHCNGYWVSEDTLRHVIKEDEVFE